ncbi:MAG: hypothetical protein ACRC62_21485 [Microcoleus sp.]
MAAIEIQLSAAELEQLDALAPVGVAAGDRYNAANLSAIDR